MVLVEVGLFYVTKNDIVIYPTESTSDGFVHVVSIPHSSPICEYIRWCRINATNCTLIDNDLLYRRYKNEITKVDIFVKDNKLR